MMFVLALALAVLVGVTLGLLGGGGSILTVPVLLFTLRMEAKQAIATSLLVVGITSAVAGVSAARRGLVMWRIGIVFGAAGMAGAYAGAQLARFVPGGVLLILFAAMMLLTGAAMLRGRKPREEVVDKPDLPIALVLLEGAAVGVVTGLVGAGGGFLIVPALVLLGGLSMERAVGTSLLVIALKSFAGLAGYLGHVAIDWSVALPIAAAAVAGSLAGRGLGRRLSGPTLQRTFAWLVIVAGAVLFARELAGA